MSGALRTPLSTAERGATLVEYALALSLLIGIFALGGRMFEASARARIDASTETVRTTAPCTGLTDPQQCL